MGNCAIRLLKYQTKAQQNHEKVKKNHAKLLNRVFLEISIKMMKNQTKMTENV